MNRQLPLVLQLDIAGNPQQWITYETSAYHMAKGNVGWSMGEVDFDIHGGTNAKTGLQSVLTINTIIAIKGHVSQKAMKHYNRVPLNNQTLFRRDQHICGYCGSGPTKHNKMTRDHVTPTCQQGLNAWMNVVTACEDCNKTKGGRTPEEAHMPLLYVPYVPNRSEWLILQNRTILADQMDFLIKKVPSDSRLL